MANAPPSAVIPDDAATRDQAPHPQLAAPYETERRTGMTHTQPCTASNDPSAPVCQLFHQLPSWNRVLWPVSMQLQEDDAPGELSLVRVNHEGIGQQQERRSSGAWVIFYTLLVSHRCVTRVDLTDAIFDGGPLNEIRLLAGRALQQNTSLRVLNIKSFPECIITRSDILATLAVMVRLQELAVHDSRDLSFLVIVLGRLIINTTALKTLNISELLLDEWDSKRLSHALRRNRTVTTLSVHTSILISRHSSGVAHFSRYLKAVTGLASLFVSGAGTETSHDDLRGIVEPLLLTRTLSELTLLGFQLDSRSVSLLAQLLVRNDRLELLNIFSCNWIPLRPPYAYTEEPFHRGEGDAEQERQAVSSYFCSFIQAFNVNRTLKFLALNLGYFTADDIRALLKALARLKSLKKVIVRGIAPEHLRAFGLAVRNTGMSGLVSFRQQYSVCPVVLTALEDCPALNDVIVNAHTMQSKNLIRAVICRLPAWSHVATLCLLLSEATLDNATVTGIAMYLSETTSLKELRLLGYNKPDLSVYTIGADRPHSLLLEALFFNKSVSALHVGEFLFGEKNLRFLAEVVRSSDTLCEFHFLPLEGGDHLKFLRFLVPGFAGNHTLLRLRTSVSIEKSTSEDHFFVEDVLVRNRGLVTCAAQFVVNNVRTDHSAAALKYLYRSPGLVKRVQDLACPDESEAVAMIQRSVQEPGGIRD